MIRSEGERPIHTGLEDHVRDAVCPRCKEKVSEPWTSEFWERFHYVTTRCTACSYKLFYKADFISAGVEK